MKRLIMFAVVFLFAMIGSLLAKEPEAVDWHYGTRFWGSMPSNVVPVTVAGSPFAAYEYTEKRLVTEDGQATPWRALVDSESGR